MKKQLSILILLSLAFNTYAEGKVIPPVEKLDTVLSKNKKVTDIKDNNSKPKFKEEQKKKNDFLISSKAVKLGLTTLGLVASAYPAYKLYEGLNGSKVPDKQDPNGHEDPSENPKYDSGQDSGAKDDGNKKDSIPNFKEIFKNGLGPDKVNWKDYRKHARLQWHNGCCWLLSFLNTVFNPSKKEIYFKYADSSIDEIIDYLDETKEKMKKYYSFDDPAQNIELLDIGTLFGKNQKELNDYLKANPNIDYNYIFENFIKNQKLQLVYYDDIEKESETIKNQLLPISIFHFINLRKVYAIGFKARCQIFRAMINNPKEVISVHNDNNGIQINYLFDELMKLPKGVRYYSPEMNDNYAKECQIENMITGTLYKHSGAVPNYIDYTCCDHDGFDKNHGGNTFNKILDLLSAFSESCFCENGVFVDFNEGKIFDSNGCMKDSKSKYYAISSVATVPAHDFCLLPKYKIDENGCIKYIGVVVLSCTVTGRDDVFIPTKTGDFREIQEIAKWYNGYRQESTKNDDVGVKKCHVISEEDLRKNIQYYTVDDDIIKRFNL